MSTIEESQLAADFLADAIARNGAAPHTVHADRGTSMTSKTVSAFLADLGVTRTHSRPRVSNDNPYSEAQYRTLKYLPDFPDHFNSLSDLLLFSWAVWQRRAQAAAGEHGHGDERFGCVESVGTFGQCS